MKRIVLIFLMSLLALNLLSNDSLIVIQLKRDITVKDSLINILESKLEAKNELHGNLNHSGKILIGSETGNVFEFIFPSLIALIVGLFALIGTLLTGRKQRKISEKQFEESQDTLEKQIEASQTTIEKQIEATKETTVKQIQSSNEIASLEFRQNVLSANRQEWIKELRETISNAIAFTETYSINPQTVNSEIYRQIKLHLTKAELMLNPEKDKQLIQELNALITCLIEIGSGVKSIDALVPIVLNIKNITTSTLKNEWIRVKRGE